MTAKNNGAFAPMGSACPEKGVAPVIRPIRPCWGVYDMVVKNESGRLLKPGVYWHTFETTSSREDDDRGGRPILDEWISTPIHVIARTVNTDDATEGRLLRLKTDRGYMEWTVPMETFGGSGEDARRQLFAMGAIIHRRRREMFMDYVVEQQPQQRFATTARPGWHESGAFVLPGRTIGSDEVRYADSGKVSTVFSVKGSIEEWKTEIAARCVGNPVLVLAVGCALAGPLLKLVGVSGGGVHLVGDSSTGKSLAQLVGSSVWGDPAQFATSWDVTKGGLEIEASSRNDTILPLDEIKRCDPRRVQEMAYSLANGVGKGTMTREREARAKISWRVLALSSGERSLSEHAAISGNAAHAGAELRMVDVNAGTRKHRAFDELHGNTGEAFHRLLTIAVTQHHGHAGPAFVEHLVSGEERSRVLNAFNAIREKFSVDSAQAGRVADRFAVIALAGELAISYGVLPWPVGSALADCLQLYTEWQTRVGSRNVEDRHILAGVRDFIDRHADSRFSDLRGYGETRVLSRAGYWEDEQDRRLYLFNRSSLTEAVDGYGVARIVRALETAKAIPKSDADRKTKKYRLPGGGTANFYVVDPERLDSAM